MSDGRMIQARHSNSLYAWIIKLIINYIPIDKYQHWFFPRKEYTCPNMNACSCRETQLETYDHVIYDYVRYNKVVSNTLTDIIGFLQDNPDAFCF